MLPAATPDDDTALLRALERQQMWELYIRYAQDHPDSDPLVQLKARLFALYRMGLSAPPTSDQIYFMLSIHHQMMHLTCPDLAAAMKAKRTDAAEDALGACLDHCQRHNDVQPIHWLVESVRLELQGHAEPKRRSLELAGLMGFQAVDPEYEQRLKLLGAHLDWAERMIGILLDYIDAYDEGDWEQRFGQTGMYADLTNLVGELEGLQRTYAQHQATLTGRLDNEAVLHQPVPHHADPWMRLRAVVIGYRQRLETERPVEAMDVLHHVYSRHADLRRYLADLLGYYAWQDVDEQTAVRWARRYDVPFLLDLMCHGVRPGQERIFPWVKALAEAVLEENPASSDTPTVHGLLALVNSDLLQATDNSRVDLLTSALQHRVRYLEALDETEEMHADVVDPLIWRGMNNAHLAAQMPGVIELELQARHLRVLKNVLDTQARPEAAQRFLPSLRNMLLNVYQRQGRMDRARLLLDETLRDEPGNVDARYQILLMDVRQGEYDTDSMLAELIELAGCCRKEDRFLLATEVELLRAQVLWQAVPPRTEACMEALDDVQRRGHWSALRDDQRAQAGWLMLAGARELGIHVNASSRVTRMMEDVPLTMETAQQLILVIRDQLRVLRERGIIADAFQGELLLPAAMRLSKMLCAADETVLAQLDPAWRRQRRLVLVETALVHGWVMQREPFVARGPALDEAMRQALFDELQTDAELVNSVDLQHIRAIHAMIEARWEDGQRFWYRIRQNFSPNDEAQRHEFWQARYGGLYCLLRQGHADEVAHVIDVLERSEADIPEPWKQALRELGNAQ